MRRSCPTTSSSCPNASSDRARPQSLLKIQVQRPLEICRYLVSDAFLESRQACHGISVTSLFDLKHLLDQVVSQKFPF